MGDGVVRAVGLVAFGASVLAWGLALQTLLGLDPRFWMFAELVAANAHSGRGVYWEALSFPLSLFTVICSAFAALTGNKIACFAGAGLALFQFLYSLVWFGLITAAAKSGRIVLVSLAEHIPFRWWQVQQNAFWPALIHFFLMLVSTGGFVYSALFGQGKAVSGPKPPPQQPPVLQPQPPPQY